MSMTECLDFAMTYADMGLSVIPIVKDEKHPAIGSWNPYRERKPHPNELLEWFSEGELNIAVVCGRVSGNLVVLDFDDEDAFRYCFTDAECLASKTMVVRTGKGWHVYFRADSMVKCCRFDNLGLDIKGDGGYVVAPPSVHPSGSRYSFEGNCSEIGLIDWGDMYSRLKQRNEEWSFVRSVLAGWETGNRQNLTLGLAAFFRKVLKYSSDRTERVLEGIAHVKKDEELVKRLDAVKSTYEKNLDQISVESWLGEELYSELMRMAKQTDRSTEGDDHDGTGDSFVHTSGVLLEDGTIVDEIVVDDRPRFIIYRKGETELRYSFEKEGVSYIPIEDDLRKKGAIILPSAANEYGSPKQLYDDILAFIEKWVECRPTDARILALAKMCEWLYERMPVLPIVNPRGASDTGKTRLGNVLWAISFRGMRADGVLTLSSLFRTAETWKGTLYINEGDMPDLSYRYDAESSQLTKFYNGRYEKNALVWRTNKETLNPEVFHSFGPTILVTRKGFGDDALESRCLRIQMLGRTRTDIPLNLPKEFYEEAEELRNKLELFRLEHLGTFENDGSIEFEGVSSRLNQMIQPMATLAKQHIPDAFTTLESAIRSYAEDEVDERSNAIDGMIVRAYFAIDQEREGKTATDIVSHVLTAYGEKLSPCSVGRRAKALGFRSRRLSGGKQRILVVDDELAQRLTKKYIPMEERTDTPPSGGCPLHLSQTSQVSQGHKEDDILEGV